METETATVRLRLIRSAVYGFFLFTVLPPSTTLYAQTGSCPTIMNTSQTSVSVCSGYLVDSLQVQTTASWPNKIELVGFESPQTNPYTGSAGVSLGELISSNGIATMRTIPFPPNTNPDDKVYYVYGLLQPRPADTTCRPFALITVNVKPGPTGTIQAYEASCKGSVSAMDGRISVLDFTTDSRFEVSTNGIFSGFSLPIPADGILVKNISRTGQRQSYGIRLYSSFGCFTQHTVTLNNGLCNCPPVVCVPIVIRKIKIGKTGQ